MNKSNFSKNRNLVAIIGLGFVGSAMAVACANSKTNNKLNFNVIGVDKKNNPTSLKRINSLNNGEFPFGITDNDLKKKTKLIIKNKNFFATDDISSISQAEVVILDINLDLKSYKTEMIDFVNFKLAIVEISKYLKKKALLLIETTVPPGTSEKIILPIIKNSFLKRGIPENCIRLAHSFERVMPGLNYLDSVRNYWRVYAGIDKSSSNLCKNFLNKIINTNNFPLTELNTTTESELTKILENSYRAASIAFIDEWGQFSQSLNLDIFKVINAIKKRPTHSNIKIPGLGVGGYCLTKDPVFIKYSLKKFYPNLKNKFPIIDLITKINRDMINNTFSVAKKFLKSIKNKKIGFVGISYKEDVGDIRSSPAVTIGHKFLKNGARIYFYDPLVDKNEVLEFYQVTKLNELSKCDLIIYTVNHEEFKNSKIINKNLNNKMIIDSFNILNNKELEAYRKKGVKVFKIGRGEIK